MQFMISRTEPFSEYRLPKLFMAEKVIVSQPDLSNERACATATGRSAWTVLDLLLIGQRIRSALLLRQGLLLQVLPEPERRLRAQYPDEHEEEERPRLLRGIQHLVCLSVCLSVCLLKTALSSQPVDVHINVPFVS